MGRINVSICLSLENIWKSWFSFAKGKGKTFDFECFQYFLEKNINELFLLLNSQKYQHHGYRKFVVNDNKKREIAVASISDRVVHRLLYDFLVSIYDKTFIFDVWSCRKNKGLLGAIERTQEALKKNQKSFVWRSDLHKFFDSVDHQILLKIISRKIKDEKALELMEKVIESNAVGIPIGNLTSQIFANIYLNELDRYVKHILKPQFYLRYGDDFILIEKNRLILEEYREKVGFFLAENLHLKINEKSDIIIRAKRGLHFLGVDVFPQGRKLRKRNWKRSVKKLSHNNFASYGGLVRKHSNQKKQKIHNWIIFEKLNF